MPRAGPRKVGRYSDEFKRTAVRLSQQPGIQVQTVAAALEIHPFMLSNGGVTRRRAGCEGDRQSPPIRAGSRDRPTPSARAQIRRAPRGARSLNKSHPVLGRSKSDRFAFIDALVTQHEGHKVTPLCRRHAVTPSGFYAWRARQDSAHAHQDRRLTVEIVRLFAAHHERYGSPRLHQALVNAGWTVSRRRVARLMHAAGLRAKAVRGYRAKAGIKARFAKHPNRLWATRVTRPNQVWVGDNHVSPRPRRLAVSRDRDGSTLATPARVDPDAAPHRGGDLRRAGSRTAPPTSPSAPDLPQRSRLRVHGRGVLRVCGAAGAPAECKRARAGRQRACRIVLSLAQGRADPRRHVSYRSRAAHGARSVHPVLQRTSPAFCTRLPIAYCVRTPDSIEL
jgi:transposase-like protein